MTIGAVCMQELVKYLNAVSLWIKASTKCMQITKKTTNVQIKAQITFTFTFSHLADAFIQSDLQLGNT